MVLLLLFWVAMHVGINSGTGWLSASCDFDIADDILKSVIQPGFVHFDTLQLFGVRSGIK